MSWLASVRLSDHLQGNAQLKNWTSAWNKIQVKDLLFNTWLLSTIGSSNFYDIQCWELISPEGNFIFAEIFVKSSRYSFWVNMPQVSDLCYLSKTLNDFGFVILDLVQKINRYNGNGAFTPHGTETGKNGFLYIMQNCSHCMEEGQGPGMGAGPENLAMGSKPIFLVPLPVPVPPSLSRFRAVWTTHKVYLNIPHLALATWQTLCISKNRTNLARNRETVSYPNRTFRPTFRLWPRHSFYRY